MLKLVPSSMLYGEESEGTAAGYMRDGHYELVSGAKHLRHDTEIVELLTPVPEGNIADAEEILAYNGGHKPYHPIPIEPFEDVEVSRPSVDRYNIAYGTLCSCGELQGATMYELGCHTGYLSFSFECCGLHVSACDRREDVIKIAEHTAHILNSRVDFQLADIKDVVANGRQYDYVLGMNVFHYLTKEMTHEETIAFVTNLGKMTRNAAVVTTLETDVLRYPEIAELGGFHTFKKVGEPVDSHAIWLLSKD